MCFHYNLISIYEYNAEKLHVLCLQSEKCKFLNAYKAIICISLIANSSEELKIGLMMDWHIFTCIMNINFIDEYVDILVNMEQLLKKMF